MASRIPRTLVVLGALACNEGKGEGVADTAGDTADSGDSEDSGDAGSAPYVTSGTIHCEPGTTGPDTLIIQVTADDPDGTESLASLGGSLAATDAGGAVVFEGLPLVCNTSGDCMTSFNANESDTGSIGCDTAPAHTFTVVVEDEDGNRSEPFVLTWEG